MKKILFITHTISAGGGAERVLNTLIDELSPEYEIDVLEWLEDTIAPYKPKRANVRHLGSVANSDRKAAKEGKNIMLNKIKHNILALTNTFFPRFLYRRHIRKEYDYEISFNYLYTSALVAHSPNRNSKKIMWMHGAIDDLNESNSSLKYRLYRRLQHKAFKEADAVVTISKPTHKSVSLFQPEIESRIHDIHNGYDFDEIEDKARAENIKKSGKFRLISIGRLEKGKNVMLQLEALEILKKRGIEVELYVVGTGEQDTLIRQHARNNSDIILTGFQHNPYPYILSADALIITSLAEGFPTVAVEAMALGKPVISTPVGGTEELIDENTGVIVGWDAGSVADGIVRLMNTDYSPEKIREKVLPYTKKRWAQNVKELLNNLDNE